MRDITTDRQDDHRNVAPRTKSRTTQELSIEAIAKPKHDRQSLFDTGVRITFQGEHHDKEVQNNKAHARRSNRDR